MRPVWRSPSPDVHYGRKNADFAQGFYTSDSREFAVRWAPQGKGITAYLNRYELDTEGLAVRKLPAWFSKAPMCWKKQRSIGREKR